MTWENVTKKNTFEDKPVKAHKSNQQYEQKP